MKIAVYGMGYVGLTGAVCLASEGHEMFGVDVSDDKVRKISAGASPIKEPGIEGMLAKALAKGQLRCTTNPVEPDSRLRYGDHLRRNAERSRRLAQHA